MCPSHLVSTLKELSCSPSFDNATYSSSTSSNSSSYPVPASHQRDDHGFCGLVFVHARGNMDVVESLHPAEVLSCLCHLFHRLSRPCFPPHSPSPPSSSRAFRGPDHETHRPRQPSRQPTGALVRPGPFSSLASTPSKERHRRRFLKALACGSHLHGLRH